MEHLGSHQMGFRAIWCLRIFQSLSRTFKCHQNLTRITAISYKDQYTFLIISRSVLKMRNVSDKICTENQNTHFVFSNIFFRKSCPSWDHHQHYHHKHQGLDHSIRSVSRVTAALANVSLVFQLFSFPVVFSGMISKVFGFVAFFASVAASSVCIRLSCLICLWSAVRGVCSRLFCGHKGRSLPEV